MLLDTIFNASSVQMIQIPDKSVDLVVTSHPYNIDIQYGNKTEKGKVVGSKGVKYDDNIDEAQYQNMLATVFGECKRVLSDTDSAWINIKNRCIDGIIQPPFWIMDYFKDMYLKNLIIWNFDWGESTNKRFAPRYEFVFWFVKDILIYTKSPCTQTMHHNK